MDEVLDIHDESVETHPCRHCARCIQRRLQRVYDGADRNSRSENVDIDGLDVPIAFAGTWCRRLCIDYHRCNSDAADLYLLPEPDHARNRRSNREVEAVLCFDGSRRLCRLQESSDTA